MASQAADGRVLILAGDGKGKTTSALGTVLRAVGHGMRVLVVQFVKAERTGEHAALERLADLVEVRLAGTGFVDARDSQGVARAAEAARRALDGAARALDEGRYGMVVLDEVLFAVGRGLLDAAAVRRAVEGRRWGVHVVLTGAGPWEAFADLADTITEMRKVKHAHDAGQGPARGVEW